MCRIRRDSIEDSPRRAAARGCTHEWAHVIRGCVSQHVQQHAGVAQRYRFFRKIHKTVRSFPTKIENATRCYVCLRGSFSSSQCFPPGEKNENGEHAKSKTLDEGPVRDREWENEAYGFVFYSFYDTCSTHYSYICHVWQMYFTYTFQFFIVQDIMGFLLPLRLDRYFYTVPQTFIVSFTCYLRKLTKKIYTCKFCCYRWGGRDRLHEQPIRHGRPQQRAEQQRQWCRNVYLQIDPLGNDGQSLGMSSLFPQRFR